MADQAARIDPASPADQAEHDDGAKPELTGSDRGWLWCRRADRAGDVFFGRVAIVGPNASGKTALLECVAGLRQPQSGRVLVNGRDIRQFDPVEYRAWIGYVPQVVPALPITVREYLRLRIPSLRDEDALLAFGRVLGPGMSVVPVVELGATGG